MILSCCFRNSNSSKKQKHKGEEAQSNLLEQYDSEPQRPRPGPGSRRNSGESFKSLKSQAQERHPPSRIEKRIQKQRSQDSTQSQQQQQLAAVAVSPSAQGSQPQLYQHRFRKTSSNVSQGQLRQERCQSQSLPSPPATPKLEIGTKRFSAGGVLHSPAHEVKIEQQQHESREKKLVSVSCQAFRSRESIICGPGETGERVANKDKESSQEVISIQRSSQASNQFNQISESAQEALAIKEQEIVAVREQYEAMIQKMKSDHSFALNQAREIYDSQVRDELNKHKKDVQEAVLNANNRANETITKLNKEIALEKVKLKEEHGEVVRKLSEELKDNEGKMQEAFMEIEQREQSWQDEKEDVLREIQRLKAEASKMVSILAAEYEEENLSEEKKRSLSAEVYSLQLVVEMRTAEVRSLREKLATASQQLEDAAVTRNSLQKADAKIEDLKEQLREKIQHERNLSTQNMELQLENRNSAREADRMSKDVEQLQWRIRNNFELPVEQRVSPLASPSDPVKCLRNSYIGVTEKQNLLRSPKLVNKITHQNVINANNNSPSKRSLFTVSDEMIEATTTSDKLGCKSEPSDLSPCSDYTDDSIEIGDEKESDQRSINNEIEELDHDADSLDEGVGDVSSDGEPQLSPVDIVDKSSLTTNSSLETVVTNVQEVRVITTQASEEEEVELRRDKRSQEPEAKSQFSTSPRLSSSPAKERIPSRYSFNNI